VDESLAEGKPENSCKSCHDIYKKDYKKKNRKREILVPQSLIGLDKEIRQPPINMDSSSTERLIQQPRVAFSGGDVLKGEKQPSQCRDAFFALLFYAHMAAMLAVAVIYGGPALSQSSAAGGASSQGANGFVYLTLVVGAVCSVLSFLSLHVLTHFAKSLIQIALVGQLLVSLMMALASLFAGQLGGFVIGMIFFAIGGCYACVVWRRIPFASALLNSAVSGIRSNLGVSLVTYGMLAVAFVYTILWSISVAGVYMAQCSDSKSPDDCSINGGYVFLLLLSFFWTQQVVQNTIHVSVAGTVATWWFAPAEANSFCSSAVTESFVRATTLSFGSICMGSLLVALIQTLRSVVEQMRRQEDGFLVCIADCILSCLEDYAQYFNRWAYVYVGMYGYNYTTAGKKVMELFQSRGWSTVISFDLVSGALFMSSVMVGLLSGICGVIIQKTFPSWSKGLGDDSGMLFFWVAFLIGLLLTSIMMSIVASAVNTVIVCFAEAPEEFQLNHPRLSDELRAAWLDMYPSEFI